MPSASQFPSVLVVTTQAVEMTSIPMCIVEVIYF